MSTIVGLVGGAVIGTGLACIEEKLHIFPKNPLMPEVGLKIIGTSCLVGAFVGAYMDGAVIWTFAGNHVSVTL